MERIKMARIKRAAQFAPFDALKGLSEALRIKEYEHDKIFRGEMSDTDAEIISNELMGLESGDNAKIVFFRDGHEHTKQGLFFPHYNEGIIELKTSTEKLVIEMHEIIGVKNLTEK